MDCNQPDETMHSNNSNNSNNSLKGTGTKSNKNNDNNNSLKGTGTNSNNSNNSLKGTGTKNNNNNNSLKGTGTNNGNKRVLRFEFSNALIESVMAFTTVHQYDDRKTYKEAWAQWLAHDEIAAMLKSEVERLTNLGYKGDVADKLFKSGRYYFRTREPTVPHTPPSRATSTPNDANGARRGQGMSRQGTSRAEPLCAEPLCSGPKALNALNQGSLHADPKPLGVRGALVAPRKYVTMGRELLRAMDEHIERGLRTNDAYTPAIGFSDFFRTYASSDMLKAEVGNLIRHYETVPNPAKKLHAKLKKTYKNRYFMMVQCNTCNTK